MGTDMSQVLIVGRSQINKVVVAKIVERSGLRPVTEAPDKAARVLRVAMPGLVILDGGADNKDCDAIIETIVAMRRGSGKPLPCVILLSNKTGDPRSLSLSSAIDEVVAKPITPERLQPVVDDMVARGRRLGL